MIIECKYCNKVLKDIPFSYEGKAMDSIKKLNELIHQESDNCECKVEREKKQKDEFYKRWDSGGGTFQDVRFAPYDSNKYPYREHLKNDCSGCPNDCGVGFNWDSLTCRKCLGKYGL